MTSDNSTSESSWSIFNTLATDDTAVDPGSTLPRHQTSLLGIDIAPGQMTANTLARPVMSNEVSHAATRVMSPNTMREVRIDYANPMMEVNTSMLLGQHACQICTVFGPDMMVCAECGLVGHPICLKMQLLEGFCFCQICHAQIQIIYDRFWAEQKTQEWQLHTKNQLRTWKKLALETMAASTSIGIAIGGAAVMAAGAATALAQGIQQGVDGSSVNRSQISPDYSTVDSRRPGSLANSTVDARRPGSPDHSIVDARRPSFLANSTVDARRRVDNIGLLPEDITSARATESSTTGGVCFKCEFGRGRHTLSLIHI